MKNITQRDVINKMLDDSETWVKKKKMTLAEYGEVFYDIHELNKLGQTHTVAQNIKEFFASHGLVIVAHGVGWNITLKGVTKC